MLFAGQCWGQAKEQSPSDFIALLADTSFGRDDAIFDCGSLAAGTEKRRGWARSLAALGPPAVPAIEEALNSAEKEGMQSKFAPGAGWLSLAYAKVRGRAAFPKLRELLGNPRLEPFQNMLGESVALSLGLTSYLASSAIPLDSDMCASLEPRHSLDRLILAWEQNNQPLFERGLGPNARAAMRDGGGWLTLKAGLWRGRSSDWAAVGYLFEIPGRWSGPEETLVQERGQEGLSLLPMDGEIDTAFEDRYGVGCGRHTVKFLPPVPADPSPHQYLIDNSDLRDLLRVVTSCSMDTAGRPGADLGH
jgi:hypothetical protein